MLVSLHRGWSAHNTYIFILTNSSSDWRAERRVEGVCCEMRTPIGQVNRKGWEGVAGHNNIRAVTKYLLKDYL